MHGLGLVALIVSAALAGCAKSEGAQPAETGPAPVASLEPIPDGGAIEGVVVDDGQAPLAGALVAIVSLQLQVQTDEGGAFGFRNLPAGAYDVAAAKLGYESVARRVTVDANQVAQAILVLVPLAVEEPYVETFGPFNGFFNCMIGTPVGIRLCLQNETVNRMVFPNENRRLHYNLTAETWQTMVGESRWTQGAFATGVGMAIYPSYSQRPGSHWWCEADGRSPILFRYERELESICTSQGGTDPEPSMKINPLVLVADPGFGGLSAENPPLRLMVQQRYELLMTVFYAEPGPPEYSGFADA